MYTVHTVHDAQDDRSPLRNVDACAGSQEVHHNVGREEHHLAPRGRRVRLGLVRGVVPEQGRKECRR